MELWDKKVDVATKMEESKHFSLQYIYKNIYDINAEQAKQLLVKVVEDTKFKAQLAAIEQGGGEDTSGMEPANQEQEAPGQLQQQVQEQTDMDIQYQPLTNNFQGNTPLNLDK